MKKTTLTNHENGNDANRLLCPRADLKFIIFHRPTGTEIQMPVLSICEEYSTVSFSTSENDYEDKYNGIGRLPSYVGNDSADDYDVYVEINGIRHLYDGIFYSDYKEVRRHGAQRLVYVPCQTQIFKITAKTIWHGIYTVLGNIFNYGTYKRN